MDNSPIENAPYWKRILLFKTEFFNLMSIPWYCVAFYKLVFISDLKVSSLALGAGFLCSVFANYRDFEMISAMGIRVKKFKKMETAAENLLERLKLQSKLMIDEIIFSILQTNLLSSEEPIWNRLLNLRENLKAAKGDLFTDHQIKSIRKHFIFEFICARFFKVKNTFRESVAAEFSNVEIKIFSHPIEDLDAFNQFVATRDKVFNMLPIYDIKLSDCERIAVSDILNRIESIKLEMKKYDVEFQIPEEFLLAIDDLRQIMDSPDILSQLNINMIINAERRIR